MLEGLTTGQRLPCPAAPCFADLRPRATVAGDEPNVRAGDRHDLLSGAEVVGDDGGDVRHVPRRAPRPVATTASRRPVGPLPHVDVDAVLPVHHARRSRVVGLGGGRHPDPAPVALNCPVGAGHEQESTATRDGVVRDDRVQGARRRPQPRPVAEAAGRHRFV